MGCTSRHQTGTLRIESPTNDSYEIYRIAGESPLQFVSEQNARYNENVPLTPGSYLVLSDCSSQTVVIYPQGEVRLAAHNIRFSTPRPPAAGDSFSVQCRRFDKTRSSQLISGRYSLNILGGKREILVGLLPQPLDLPTEGAGQILEFPLSALQVSEATVTGSTQNQPYFVSPGVGALSITQAQKFGSWQFLPEGQYVVELNGTKMAVDLKRAEEFVIAPAYVRVKTSPGADIETGTRITGSPISVEINGGHSLSLNDVYPVLPGTSEVRLQGSVQSTAIQLESHKLLELEPRSITVDGNCAPDEWVCLGGREIALFRENEPYPFAKGVTDVPLLFFEEQAWLGVEGSRDIRLQLSSRERDIKTRLGFVEFRPTPTAKTGLLTDLMRIEPTSGSQRGTTLDLALDRPTTVALTPGVYTLSHYVTQTPSESLRRRTTRRLVVEPGSRQVVEEVAYLSDKRMALLKPDTPKAAR